MFKNISDLPTDAIIQSVNTLQDAREGELAFFDNVKYKDAFSSTKASFVIARPKFIDIKQQHIIMLQSDDPYRLYAFCAQALYDDRNLTTSVWSDYAQDQFGAWVHKDALLEKNIQTSLGVIIHAGAEIGSGTILGSNVTIGRGVAIGRQCVIHSGSQISHSFIGDNVNICLVRLLGNLVLVMHLVPIIQQCTIGRCYYSGFCTCGCWYSY